MTDTYLGMQFLLVHITVHSFTVLRYVAENLQIKGKTREQNERNCL